MPAGILGLLGRHRYASMCRGGYPERTRSELASSVAAAGECEPTRAGRARAGVTRSVARCLGPGVVGENA
jgi:hypothetical protein